jgi:hypothetical protein
LTARIEFGGPQFLLRGVDGNAQVYNTCVYAGGRKYQRSAGSPSRAPAGAVAASVPGCRH